jgi:large subunit ribosomal protein LP1
MTDELHGPVQQDLHSDFLQALEGKDIKDLLTNVGSAGAAAPAGAAAAGGAAAPAEAAAEEKKEEGNDSIHEVVEKGTRNADFSTEKEESDDDMGFGLFD